MTRKINVGRLGSVELIEVRGNERAVLNAARKSYNKDNFDEITNTSKLELKDRRLLSLLLFENHTSPFEFMSFVFKIECPMVVLWQMTRHRTFKFSHLNVSSGRYTSYDEPYKVDITEWRGQSKSNKQMSDGMLNISPELHAKYLQSVDMAMKVYYELLEAGVAREQARLVTPGFSMMHEFVLEVDVSNLMNFLRLRLGKTAQSEIVEFAKAMYTIFSEEAPYLARLFDIYNRVLQDTYTKLKVIRDDLHIEESGENWYQRGFGFLPKRLGSKLRKVFEFAKGKRSNL